MAYGDPVKKKRGNNLKSKAAAKSAKSVAFKSKRPKTATQKKSGKVLKRHSF